MAWCPWCRQKDDGTENRICERHLNAMLTGLDMKLSECNAKYARGIVCRSCGYVNPPKTRKPYKRVKV